MRNQCIALLDFHFPLFCFSPSELFINHSGIRNDRKGCIPARTKIICTTQDKSFASWTRDEKIKFSWKQRQRQCCTSMQRVHWPNAEFPANHSSAIYWTIVSHSELYIVSVLHYRAQNFSSLHCMIYTFLHWTLDQIGHWSTLYRTVCWAVTVLGAFIFTVLHWLTLLD